eukprot:6467343-Amphidinium_carterae.1
MVKKRWIQEHHSKEGNLKGFQIIKEPDIEAPGDEGGYVAPAADAVASADRPADTAWEQKWQATWGRVNPT